MRGFIVLFLISQQAMSLAVAAKKQVGVTVNYDPSYVTLRYPLGDVPVDRGVCSDVVVRAFRTIGVDLQAEVHKDMLRNFGAYPRKWNLSAPDANIDHRRVPNLMRFFARRGKTASGDYEPGDVVAWQLPGGLYHVGVVSNDKIAGTNRYSVVHNIGRGAQNEDVLLTWPILGHYRW
jgi:uncharacterized protein YijF (DUF1287 family)